jgi:hypothetical protein
MGCLGLHWQTAEALQRDCLWDGFVLQCTHLVSGPSIILTHVLPAYGFSHASVE